MLFQRLDNFDSQGETNNFYCRILSFCQINVTKRMFNLELIKSSKSSSSKNSYLLFSGLVLLLSLDDHLKMNFFEYFWKAL